MLYDIVVAFFAVLGICLLALEILRLCGRYRTDVYVSDKEKAGADVIIVNDAEREKVLAALAAAYGKIYISNGENGWTEKKSSSKE